MSAFSDIFVYISFIDREPGGVRAAEKPTNFLAYTNIPNDLGVPDVGVWRGTAGGYGQEGHMNGTQKSARLPQKRTIWNYPKFEDTCPQTHTMHLPDILDGGRGQTDKISVFMKMG